MLKPFQQNSVKTWILNNWTTRKTTLEEILKKNPGRFPLKTKEKVDHSLFNNPVCFTSRFRGPLELQRYLSLIILKISAFFPCLIRINRKLNTVTSQLSILRRDKNVFLGELVHKPTSVSEIWHFPTKQSQYKEWNHGSYNSNTRWFCNIWFLTGECLYLLVSSHDPQTTGNFITYRSFRGVPWYSGAPFLGKVPLTPP